MDYAQRFGEDTVKKNIQMTGIKESYHCSPEQTVSDLGFAAAENLLNEKQIDRSTIGALIFVASYADYFSPATSFVLQKRLGLGLRLAFYPDKVGFRNQKVIHKELTAHPNINGIRLLGEIGHFQRLVQGRLRIFRWPDIRQLNVVV